MDCACGQIITLGFLEADGSFTIETGPIVCWEHYMGEEVEQ